ncbi:MAG: elongation factor Ts [Candidatus Omnitrophica bacterium]|jgi:elongation factor Ts|nr:elongation factor Ts [Candidatus Omnitrophota bacterium]
MSSQIEQIKTLREKTGLGVIECKKALEESGNSIEKALEFLKQKGIQLAEKKESRETKEGLIGSYVHTNGKIGVLIEVACESDFVARTEDFKELVKNLSLHIAALSPTWITKESVPIEIIKEKEKNFGQQAETKLEEFFKEKVLFNQPFVRDNSISVEAYIKEKIAKLGENIKVSRFARFQIGE